MFVSCAANSVTSSAVSSRRASAAMRSTSARVRTSDMRTDSIRPAAVAGSWYPGYRGALERDVDGYLEAVGPDAGPRGRLARSIAPHAGLMFSGPVGAYSYKAAEAMGVHDTIVGVVPSYSMAFAGVALYPSGAFETPLGNVAIDESLGAELAAASPIVQPLPAAPRREPSLPRPLRVT